MKNLLLTTYVIAALAVSMPAQAQGQQPPPTSRPTQAPPATTPPVLAPPGQRPATPAPGATTVPPQTPASVWNNIKLDITIVDSQTGATTVRKVLSLHVADGRQSQMRTQSENGLINIDARPQMRHDGKSIVLQLTLEYRQGVNGAQFTESLTTVVVDGKPLVLSQSADASNDRKVSVEVTATIQKD